MAISHRIRQSLTALVLILVLTFTTACSGVVSRSTQANYTTPTDHRTEYSKLARGDSSAGQEFGDWVVRTSQGLIKDAYVRDNNKLGAVISPQVRPNDLKPLTQSLAQGFRRNFPNQDLTILMYAPNKELLLTARYDAQSRQIEYQPAA
jgi:hypothetical protein